MPIGVRPKVVVAEEFRVEFVRSDIANTETTQQKEQMREALKLIISALDGFCAHSLALALLT